MLLTSYLVNNDAGTAYRNRKSLLDSEHLSNVMTQNISNNIKYTFARGYCFQEQATMFGLLTQGYWKHSRG